jgi:hypothetical protein
MKKKRADCCYECLKDTFYSIPGVSMDLPFFYKRKQVYHTKWSVIIGWTLLIIFATVIKFVG